MSTSPAYPQNPTTATTGFNIEYARFEKRGTFFRSQQANQVEHHYHELVQAYDKYHENLLQGFRDKQDAFDKKVTAYKTKVCFCGHPMRYISDYNFWGCANFKDKTKQHITFRSETEFFPPSFTVPYTWLPDIINLAGLKGVVKVKQLYECLMDNGFDDLKLLYNNKSSEINFTGFIKANQRSKVQEKECMEYLKTRFTKVAYQQSITYKLTGEKETFCIPDFICSDNWRIVVVDAKLDYTDDEKMDLYTALVRHIVNLKQDNRFVKGAHIMYAKDVSLYQKTRYELIKI